MTNQAPSLRTGILLVDLIPHAREARTEQTIREVRRCLEALSERCATPRAAAERGGALHDPRALLFKLSQGAPTVAPDPGSLDHLAVLRQAYRTLRGRYPRPFARVSWTLVGDDLQWSACGRGLRSGRALAPDNHDLPAEFHQVAARRHARAVKAYALIESAHVVRWYASAAFPQRARPLLGVSPGDRDRATEELFSAVATYSARAMDWMHFLASEARDEERKAARTEAFREVALINAKRSEDGASQAARALQSGIQYISPFLK